MPRAWSIEELRRFEEIKQGLNAPQERPTTPTRQRYAAPARARRPAGRRPGDNRSARQQ